MVWVQHMSHKRFIAVILLVATSVASPAFADSNASGPAKVEIGQKEVVKNLLWRGPSLKADVKYVLKSYRIVAKPEKALNYTFIVTHVDGSTETFPAEEGNHPNFERIFSGRTLDLKMTRVSDDTSTPIDVMVSRHTRNEREENFP